ncbi:hypothetical protein B0T10DRAFT_253964 [Thelonectria olida]|uniref:PAC domain-containing protein n=1 Tax=Thelonectria olida TaxID=1576542 RepID=A0A9P9ASK3_9HYPO|nr:hypothetical protein B0T10DRAFT_253964 [Thelonectria olida]
MPTLNSLRTFEPPLPPFAEYERRRSTTSTLSSSNAESIGSSLRGLTTSPSNRSKNGSARPKSAKFSAYRLRSNSGLSVHTNEDLLRQYTDYHPDGSPRVSMFNSGGERLRSIDSITTSSQRSSITFTDSDTSADLPIPDFVGRDMFDMVMKDDAASGQLWKFAASRGVGQNVEYLMKLRDYINSLEQVVVQLSTISTSYTSITATSPLGLPASMSKALNTNIKHLTTSLIPSLENMFLESKGYVEQRIVRDIFPAFVKQQLSLCTSIALSSEVEGDLPPTPFPGLKSSFCLSDPVKPGNPMVFTSDEFQDLTGYTRAEVMSRNCRLLQGPQTDRESIANVRAALWRGDSCSELILNFRRDGQPFWNLLFLCPLQDAAGKTKFYLGAQIDVSSNIESNDELLKMLSYGSTEDDSISTNDRSSPRWTNEGSQGDPELEELTTIKSNPQLKSPKLSFFKSFKKPPPPPLSPPLSPRRSSDRPRSSAGPALEKTYSTRTVLKRLSTPPDMMMMPYSRYMILEHVPSYPASLGAMPLDQEMRYPPKLCVAFFSQPMVDALDLGMAADVIRGKDVFDVLAEQATLPNVTKAFKSTVRDVVVRDGRSISLDLALTNHIPRRATTARTLNGDEAGRDRKSNKMMSHWTPLKDADGRVKYVVLIISPL